MHEGSSVQRGAVGTGGGGGGHLHLDQSITQGSWGLWAEWSSGTRGSSRDTRDEDRHSESLEEAELRKRTYQSFHHLRKINKSANSCSYCGHFKLCQKKQQVIQSSDISGMSFHPDPVSPAPAWLNQWASGAPGRPLSADELFKWLEYFRCSIGQKKWKQGSWVSEWQLTLWSTRKCDGLIPVYTDITQRLLIAAVTNGSRGDSPLTWRQGAAPGLTRQVTTDPTWLYWGREREREGERGREMGEREREGEGERGRERERGRQREREGERGRGREREREGERGRERERERDAGTQRHRDTETEGDTGYIVKGESLEAIKIRSSQKL